MWPLVLLDPERQKINLMQPVKLMQEVNIINTFEISTFTAHAIAEGTGLIPWGLG